jgi:Transposase DDE domain
VRVNHHSLSDFRNDAVDLLNELLTQSVTLLLSQDLVQLKRVAQDGMKVRASAGAASFRTRGKLEKLERIAREQVETLTKEIDEDPGAGAKREEAARKRAAEDRAERLARAIEQMTDAERRKRSNNGKKKTEARTSTTDPSARVMKMADGGFRPAYNVQFATDCDSGVVLTAAATTQGTDNGELGRGADRITTRYGRCPAALLVDYGFARLGDIDRLAADHGAAVYMPLKAADKWLARGDDPYLPRPKDSPAVVAWRARMGTAEEAEVYKLRASTAEWVNAGCRNRGLYQLRVRGLAKVRACVWWQALAHNLTRMAAVRRAG